MSSLLHDAVRIEREGATAVVTIAHPPVNAINRDVVAGLGEALTAAEADPECRALVITGDGPKCFAAGADIGEFLAQGGAEAVGATQQLTCRIEESRLPVIAAVNGIAFGGGCELTLACDVRIAAATARFGQPEINLGIIPGWGGTQRLPRLIGRGPALPLLLTGEPIDARRAYELGLVAEVCEAGDLMDRALDWAQRLGAKAPLALAATKRAVNAGLDRPLADGLAAELGEFVTLFGTDDAREGITAFLEKRPARWTGR